ncbi:MAG: SDR family oxidoreductase [Rhodospirillales bacterium]|nr:SDR family oxidoreductase [Rhodospirillales bacterium]
MTALAPLQPYAPIALVTGAGRRVGRHLALSLAADGWQLALHYRSSADEAGQLAREIVAGGGKVQTYAAELSREDEAAGLIPAIRRRQGPVGLLVNNAGHFQRDTWDSVTAEGWDRHMEANVRAPMLLSQALAEQLPGDRRGLIVNMLDQRVWNPGPAFVSYGVSKSGLWALTRTLALALAPRIRVNGIGPGFMLPDVGGDPELFRKRVARQPLKRGGSLAEVSAALRFFVEAASVTGQMIVLDGGQHLV